MTITTGAHPLALWPGIHSWFGAVYNEHGQEWKDLFDLDSSTQNFERVATTTGFGLVPEKSQGGSFSYVDHGQQWKHDFVHVAYGMGYIVTYEEKRDNLYEQLGKERSGALGFSFRQTTEVVHANIYNRAFNSSYLWGDSKEICATDHPMANGSTFSNELNPAADFSETSLEDLLVQMSGATEDQGLNIALKAKTLIYPRQLQFEVKRVLDSVLQNDTANNAINAVNDAIPNRRMNHYLTDADAWFIRTDIPDGMVCFARDHFPAPLFEQDNDFDTKNAKAAGYMRFSAGSRNPRGLYGSEGA
jgi:hypothetical protein